MRATKELLNEEGFPHLGQGFLFPLHAYVHGLGLLQESAVTLLLNVPKLPLLDVHVTIILFSSTFFFPFHYLSLSGGSMVMLVFGFRGLGSWE